MGLLCLSQAQAIIIRHDLEDSRYIVYPEQYPQLFYLHTRFGNKICVATLISPQWAITAGHCIEETPLGEQFAAREPYPVLIDGNTHDITQVVMHPAYAHPQQLEAVDLALIKLDQAVNIQPAALYQEQDELNQVVSFLGWGFQVWAHQAGLLMMVI